MASSEYCFACFGSVVLSCVFIKVLLPLALGPICALCLCPCLPGLSQSGCMCHFLCKPTPVQHTTCKPPHADETLTFAPMKFCNFWGFSVAEPQGWCLEPNESCRSQLKAAPTPHPSDPVTLLSTVKFFPAWGKFVSELDWILYLQRSEVYRVRHTTAICREMIPLWHLGEEYESIMPKCCYCLSSCGTKQGFSQGFRGEGAAVGIMVSGSQQNTQNSWERALI